MAAEQTSSHLANVRDLGGVAPSLRKGVLVRADAPAQGDVAPQGIEPWPPATVVDLRGPAEKGRPHGLGDVATIVDVEVLAQAHLTGEQARETLESLDALYMEMTQGQAATALVAAVEMLATAQAPVLFHCSVGKDRTGVLAALVEALVGVERDAIIADYTATGPHMQAVIGRMMAGVRPEFAQAALASVPPEVFEAPAHAIEAVLDRWDREGGVEQWYFAHGGTEPVLVALRERLLG